MRGRSRSLLAKATSELPGRTALRTSSPGRCGTRCLDRYLRRRRGAASMRWPAECVAGQSWVVPRSDALAPMPGREFFIRGQKRQNTAMRRRSRAHAATAERGLRRQKVQAPGCEGPAGVARLQATARAAGEGRPQPGRKGPVNGPHEWPAIRRPAIRVVPRDNGAPSLENVQGAGPMCLEHLSRRRAPRGLTAPQGEGPIDTWNFGSGFIHSGQGG